MAVYLTRKPAVSWFLSGSAGSGAVEARRPERTQQPCFDPVKDLLRYQPRQERSQGNPAVRDYNVETVDRIDPPADRPPVHRERAQADMRSLNASLSEARAQIGGTLQ